MIGQSLGHYRITAAIGAGGMGEVYRATDTKLGRDVALKVLPAEVAADPDRLDRFQREARALAALDHPGIVSVHSVEEADGVHFLTMQLVEGQSLDLLIPDGGFPLDQLLDIAVPLSDALAAAHEKSIVHRDLKPSNVMVGERGRVKVLDFGLAKLAEPKTGELLVSQLPTEMRTREGVVMGTMPYMSPEQVSGRTLDHRTDIFSLGIILYEMASGRRPFQGNSSAELISSILRDSPLAVTELRGDLPRDLARIIRRCLEKDTRDRYQTSRDVYNELKELRAETSSSSWAPVSSPRSDAGGGARPPSGAIRADAGFWVAVLPFKHQGAAAELDALAEGMTEEILTGLSRFSYLRVIARGSPVDLRASGKEPGASYVIEGSLRQAGAKLRVAAQLVDTTTGAHLWAETYDRAFNPDAIFELQDELVPRIVSTIADQHGILVRSITAVIRNKADAQLSPYEAVFRVFGLHERMSPQEHAAVRELLERVVRDAPDQSDSWAMLATLYSDEYMFGFHGRPDPLGRALVAARRAVEGAPASPLASQAMAQSLFFRRERQAFRPVAERTIALNPMDGATMAFMGILLACAGDWEHGSAVADSAMRLNPHFPGWYWLAAVFNAYRTRDYRAAIDAALRIQMPGYFWPPATCAAAFGQLGETPAARKAIEELLAIRPEFAKAAREEFGKWFEPELVEHLMDGLQKAGLEIATEGEAAAPAVERARSSADVSGAARADEGFWVAVLPFKSTGTSTELKALADGLSEEVVAGLSRFSYLRVITGGSTQRYADQSPDLRVVGKELGARYVMNGNLRQVGARLRVAVQLVDAATGAQLWAETYERPFRPEAVFELQDDLVPRIVSTVADMHGVLPHSMSEAVRIKAPDQMSPYEALLRSFGYNERFTPEDHAEVRTCLERAVQQAPGNADCWAMLSLMYANEYGHWGNPGPGSLERALRAARTAVEAAPLSSLPYYALAQALFFRREIPAFRVAAERAVSLNPMDGATAAFMGLLIAYAGDWERGCALSEKGLQLNPNHPGLYRYTAWHDAYRKKDYRGALDVALKLNAPKNFYTHAVLAICYAQLGQMEQARKALRDLLALKPDYAQVARELHGRWIEPDLVEQLMDGLRKAGLDVPTATTESSQTARDATVAIAVLPFSDLSPAKDQEYLCEGMAEEIMNALVGVGGIRVASRTSAFRARRQEEDLAKIARALNVGHVLEGSVRTAGNRIRVTAQLTDVATGYQLWSERFDRKAGDIFSVQDEIAAGVVEAVKARLAPGERIVRARPQAGNLEAYRHYLKGRHLRYTKNDHAGALLCFEQAVALDPSHGPSWVGLGEINVLAAAYGMKPSREAYVAAKTALATAAGLQGESAEALYVEGMIAFGERRWKDSERVLARAMEIEPGHVQARCWTANLLCLQGRREEAILALERAREIDPLAPYPYAMTGLCLLQARRAEKADRFLDQALAFDEDNILALWVSGAAKAAQELFDPAISRLERALTLSHRGAFIHGTLGWALAAAGKADDARRVLKALRARPSPATTPLPEAWMLAALGDREAAWEVLDRACDEKQLLVAFTGLPGLDPLRSDPRFPAFLERLGLPVSGPSGPSA